MANRIIAVDLGAWSVKVAIAQPGLRHASLTAFVERSVPEGGDEPWETRAARVLADIAREHRIEHDSIYITVPGDAVFAHVLEFGFKNLRRADLEKAVGAELEGVVPLELEDMVYAFEALPPDDAVPPPVEPAAGRVAPPSHGMRVLTYAMARDRAAAWLDQATRAGAPPRGLVPEAGPMARLVERAPSLADLRARGPIAVVDAGHTRTDVVVVKSGKPVYVRSIARGGRDITSAIARNWKLDWATAEAAKHKDGFIASTTMPAQTEQWQRISEVVREELAPLARDLRQTFAACRAKTGVAVSAVLLVGGTSRVRGLDHFFAEQLGIPVTMLAGGDVEAMVGAKLASTVPADAAALALGMIADAGTGRPLLDLRSGALAAKVDLSFFRARAAGLAAAAIAIVACITASGWTSFYKLRKAQDVLTERLAVESTEQYGEPKTAKEVLDTDNTSATAEASPLPKMTAWDILLDLDAKMPPREKVTVDIESVEIDATKIEVKGTAKTTDEVDTIEGALKSETCFQDVTRVGSIQQDAQKNWQFEFSIKNACM